MTNEKLPELLGVEVSNQYQGLQTPLCVSHYKQIHRLLHPDDDMYTDKRCYTCRALIHGTARHCPNPKSIQQYFSMNADLDIHNIIENDYICFSCYNHHLLIVQRVESRSTDQELQTFLSSQQAPVMWVEQQDSCVSLDVYAVAIHNVTKPWKV